MAIYSRMEEWLTTPTEGELLMMNMKSGAFQGLNQAGAFLWDILSEPHSREAMLGAFLAEFDVSYEQAGADIDVFLAEMVECGLLRVQAVA